VTTGRSLERAVGGDGHSGPLRLFYSYAHEDTSLLARLRTHLAPLRRDRILTDWCDREIMAGTEWDSEISDRLGSSDIVVVLVSADLLESDYVHGRELGRALRMHRAGRVRVVPVIAKDCLWQTQPIGKLQVLPAGAKPITNWKPRDSAYVSVVAGIERVAREITSNAHSLHDDWITSRLLRRRVIRAVQEHLTQLDLYAGPIDGVPGRQTEIAVRELQRRGNVRVDGMIGPDVIRLVTSAADPQISEGDASLDRTV
jgi:hypothetical protein